MMCTTKVARVLLLTAVSAAVFGAMLPDSVRASAHRGLKIEWPDRMDRTVTLQSVVDAAPDGATVEIRRGDHEVASPVFITGKRLTIAGAGSGRRGGRVTRLIGPPPEPVVDREGNVVLRAEEVIGLFNLSAAEVVVRDLVLMGFDAAIVSRDDDAGNAASLRVQDVVIANTGRGIRSTSKGPVTVADTTIRDTVWNAVIVKNAAALTLADVEILGPGHAGLLLASIGTMTLQELLVLDAKSAGAFIVDSGCGTGLVIVQKVSVAYSEPGLLTIRSCLALEKSVFFGNKFAGIIALGSSINVTAGHIGFTEPNGKGLFGDGIMLMVDEDTSKPTTAFVTDVGITNSSRAGVSSFGSTVTLTNNEIACGGFDVIGDPYLGFTVNDGGGNKCGCPKTDGTCSIQTVCCVAPQPVVPPE